VVTTTWIPPDAGPELVEVPLADLDIIMEPGMATQEEIDSKLAEAYGYVPGSGVHLATYPGPSRTDIYRFTSTDTSPGPGTDGPAVCTAEAPFGQPINGWTCGGPTERTAEYGIWGTGSSVSDRGDYTMTIEVGTKAENVVIETTTGYTIVIRPAGGVAYAAWKQHPPLRVTVFHYDGTTSSEVVGP
jgi:hypothetical protein